MKDYNNFIVSHNGQDLKNQLELVVKKARLSERNRIKRIIKKMKRPYDIDAIPNCQMGHTVFCDCDTYNNTLNEILENI